jgi:hypothetical protein
MYSGKIALPPGGGGLRISSQECREKRNNNSNRKNCIVLSREFCSCKKIKTCLEFDTDIDDCCHFLFLDIF